MQFIEYRGDIVATTTRNQQQHLSMTDLWIMAKNKKVDNIEALVKVREAHQKYKCTYDESIMAVLARLQGPSCFTDADADTDAYADAGTCTSRTR
jgi:hypothetical protein